MTPTNWSSGLRVMSETSPYKASVKTLDIPTADPRLKNVDLRPLNPKYET